MIYIVPISNRKVASWIRFNETNTCVDCLPCFVIRHGNEKPQIHSLTNADYVYKIATEQSKSLKRVRFQD